MKIAGSCLSFPFRPDQRGALATISDPVEIVKQSIWSILETRQGERVMLPDYGIPDFVFDVVNAGFAGKVKHFLEEQIRDYEPLVDEMSILVGILEDNLFTAGFTRDQSLVAINIKFTVRGSNIPGNLVFPMWTLRERLSLA